MTSSLKAEFIDDCTLELEWDVNDPECAFLNGKTEEEIHDFIIEALETFIKEHEEREEDKYLEHLIR